MALELSFTDYDSNLCVYNDNILIFFLLNVDISMEFEFFTNSVKNGDYITVDIIMVEWLTFWCVRNKTFLS